MKIFFKALKKNWLTWLGLLLFIIFFSSLAFGDLKEWLVLKGEIREKEIEIKEVKKEVEDLSLELKRVSNEDYLEKEARAKLNLKKEGEEVFAVLGLENIEKEEDFSNVFEVLIEDSDYRWLNIKSWANYFFRIHP